MRNRTLQIARDEPSMGEIAQSHIGDLLIIREKKKCTSLRGTRARDELKIRKITKNCKKLLKEWEKLCMMARG